MKLSVASSVLMNYSIKAAIPVIAEAGYKAVDIWGGRPHVYRQDYSSEELSELRSRVERHNLSVASFMPAFFRYPHSLSNPNERVREDSIEYMRICAYNAAVLGAEILLVVPGRSLFDQTRRDAFERLVDSVRTVCEFCEQYDFLLGIEPANEMITDLVVTHKDALTVIEQVGHDALGVVMDTGHMHLNGESLKTAIGNLGDKLLQFHVNDNDGRVQQNDIPGDGSYDFQAFLKHLKEKDYNGYLSMELGYQYTGDPYPALEEARKRMESWM